MQFLSCCWNLERWLTGFGQQHPGGYARLVGGHIEVLSLPGGGQLVCNEDGKFLTLPQNRALKDELEKWWMYWLEPAYLWRKRR